ncbi:MAG: carboxypeptidase regulatory-like domain-containing protein [Acidobacteria bacterium]|nr:carboxypeptidase regulatory-like domain-containing protein [Acidobacteriota bacterium]
MQRYWMRRIPRLAVAVLPLVAWGCGNAPSVTGPSDSGIAVRGRVVDFRAQAPVAGAVVQFSSGEGPAERLEARTTTNGSYEMSLPYLGRYSVVVNGAPAGVALVRGPSYRGDLLLDPVECGLRYGTLTDAQTGRPVSGAIVESGTARRTTSASDGWYALDFGCGPLDFTRGLNTTVMVVTHPNYALRSPVLGRGVFYGLRLDLDLEPR